MKKLFFCILYMFSIPLFCPVPLHANCNSNVSTDFTVTSKPSCCTSLITLLYPYITKEINNYYKDYFTTLPSMAPYMIEIVELQTNPESIYGPADFILVVEAMPYFGAHDPVGKDRITFKINLDGIQSIEFKHIESGHIYPNHQPDIIKPLP